MPFKSQAQRRKFAVLLVEGKIAPDTFEEWNRETGGARLPERVVRKSATKAGVRKQSAANKSTTKKSAKKRSAKKNPAKTLAARKNVARKNAVKRPRRG